jgi:hypothetical protein
MHAHARRHVGADWIGRFDAIVAYATGLASSAIAEQALAEAAVSGPVYRST